MKAGLLSFNRLTRRINSHGRQIDVSGQVEAGGVLSVQGASGAGKSTLLRVLARLMAAHGGEVFLQGRSWQEIPPQEWRTRVQYVAQKPVLFEGTGEENLRVPFLLRAVQQKKSYSPVMARDYLRQLHIHESILSQPARSLSGGEAARLSLVRALLLDPEVLLLDEPTASLDADNRERLMGVLSRWVGQQQRAIVMVSHSESDLLAFSRYGTLHLESLRGL